MVVAQAESAKADKARINPRIERLLCDLRAIFVSLCSDLNTKAQRTTKRTKKMPTRLLRYGSGASAGLQHAAFDLVEFDTLEQGFEIAFAEAFVAFALDEFEKNRADSVLAEDLQQQALAFAGRAVDQD